MKNYLPYLCKILILGSMFSTNTFAFQKGEKGYQNIHPSWSHSGNEIMFDSDRTGNWEIYIMNKDGSNVRQITNDPGHDGMASFTSDDKKIVYLHNGSGKKDGAWEKAEMYIMNKDGTNKMKITGDNIEPGGMYSWSSDNKRLYYQIKVTDKPNVLYSMLPNGNDKRLEPAQFMNKLPKFSLDNKYAVVSSKSAGDGDIFLFNSAGKKLANLSNHPGHDAAPEWSPDGKRIAFQSRRTANYSIYVMDSNGDNLTALTDDTSFDLVPKWSPDGTKIIFESDLNSPTDGMNILIMDADGKNKKLLTSNSGNK